MVAAHFPYANGIVPDGVARWCWDVLRALRRADIDAYGVGCVGSSTVDHEIVPPEKLVGSVLEQKPKVCIIHTSCKGEELLRACAEHNIKSLWVQPYWGIMDEVRSLVALATVTIVPTPEYAEDLRKATGRRVEAIPFPIDTDFWCPGEGQWPVLFLAPNEYQIKNVIEKWEASPDGLNIVYAGRMGVGKKIHEFVPFYKRYLIDHLPKHRLLFAGPDESSVRGLLQESIGGCRVGETARHVSWYVGTDEDLRNLYRTADVFVFPSSWESYGYTPLEAISCATPLATFGAPQVPSMGYFPKYPYATEPGDWKGFCDNVLKIVEDPARAGETMLKYREALRSIMGTDAVMLKILRLIEEK